MQTKTIPYPMLFLCVCFFLLCLIPMFTLSQDEISEYENRKLTSLPSFWKNDTFNNQFDEQYENYLKDHFPKRWKLIKFYYHLQYSIMNRIENEKAFIGDNGWMFSLYDVRDKNLNEEKRAINYILRRAENFLNYIQTKPIDVYFFLIPNRTQIYHQYWDKYYANRIHLHRGDELKKRLSKYPNVYVFYPFEQLSLLSRKEDVFPKHDIHLYGKTGLQPLVDTFSAILQEKYFPQVTKYPKIKYGQATDGPDENAHYADLLFLDMKRKITSFKPVSGKYLSVEENIYDKMNLTTVNPDAPADKSVLVVGNCFAESLFAQIRELFSKAYLYRYNIDNRISSSQKLSLDDIDVIIIAVTEDNMANLSFLDVIRNML